MFVKALQRIQSGFGYCKRVVRWIWRYGLALTSFAVLFTLIVPRSTVLVNDPLQTIAYTISPQHFDYIGWELGAIAAKADQRLFGSHAYMTESARSDFVRQYMADLAAVQSLEAQIAAAFVDPAITDPIGATAALQAERDANRQSLVARQTSVEGILEGQIATILVEQGFGIFGQLMPPMAMRFTRMPNLLVISPRDEIRLTASYALYAQPIDAIVTLEHALEAAEEEFSVLIVPLGGIALYPAMIQETASLPFAIETFAHEWLHHYLYFFPLGLSYFTGDGFGGEGRIINETTADLFGKEIAARVIERYYPELPIPQLPTYQATEPPPPPDPNAFDFGAEMNETRVTVDDLLARGALDEAEAYMEMRRQFFYENGYRIRRINQAFFAFYGGYQAGGGISGAGGTDPTGPAILEIRRQSATILAFIMTMRQITNRIQLLAIYGQ